MFDEGEKAECVAQKESEGLGCPSATAGVGLERCTLISLITQSMFLVKRQQRCHRNNALMTHFLKRNRSVTEEEAQGHVFTEVSCVEVTWVETGVFVWAVADSIER